uniref:Uncharacterized protein n=1 Tax=Bursaphelenchus xylophilus TaxID=6326 RepID=A0A1I7RIB0_BURXY
MDPVDTQIIRHIAAISTMFHQRVSFRKREGKSEAIVGKIRHRNLSSSTVDTPAQQIQSTGPISGVDIAAAEAAKEWHKVLRRRHGSQDDENKEDKKLGEHVLVQI